MTQITSDDFKKGVRAAFDYMMIAFLLSGCCLDYKHDAAKQIELYQKCRTNDDHEFTTYCQDIAEEGSRIEGSCK